MKKALFAKLLMLACLTLVLGMKALSLLSNSEALLVAPHHIAAGETSLAAHSAVGGHAQHISPLPEKQSIHQFVLFEDDKASEVKLQKESKAGIDQIFSFTSKFELSSRLLAFIKTYSTHLSATEHYAPLYLLDRAFLI